MKATRRFALSRSAVASVPHGSASADVCCDDCSSSDGERAMMRSSSASMALSSVMHLLRSIWRGEERGWKGREAAALRGEGKHQRHVSGGVRKGVVPCKQRSRTGSSISVSDSTATRAITSAVDPNAPLLNS